MASAAKSPTESGVRDLPGPSQDVACDIWCAGQYPEPEMSGALYFAEAVPDEDQLAIFTSYEGLNDVDIAFGFGTLFLVIGVILVVLGIIFSPYEGYLDFLVCGLVALALGSCCAFPGMRTIWRGPRPTMQRVAIGLTAVLVANRVGEDFVVTRIPFATIKSFFSEGTHGGPKSRFIHDEVTILQRRSSGRLVTHKLHLVYSQYTRRHSGHRGHLAINVGANFIETLSMRMRDARAAVPDAVAVPIADLSADVKV
ncbi:Hypothetical Protein FCC1311_054512 [Hondaea fermentalgiana]|uniref:Uncharacterized protein n=1 Tax=Hondaea fermentalgiana TaxID=2315210 RepID=A0A2R5GFY0_9STRA|nr:Hypothetical Protein FCC1311_054512 [Hondaea fermentalgiana]|eukprot:GBG29229.1 Hypothetical Protein FCC1311_054512 [Hondaea fermentalgiana]